MIPSSELIVDNFAGGGGASLGIEMALGRSPDIAINHDPEAVAMHQANHPDCEHYCESVWEVDPVKACGGRPVGLAWFSPDCKHFSKAKGGKPVNKNIRGLAWIVVKWAKLVRPRVIILENVEEFQQWGPLTDEGLPCPKRKGFTFRRWLAQLKNLGYAVEWRELRACDYGAPTIRKRLFLVARCDGQPIVWPQPTHGDPKKIENSLFDRHLKPWHTAAECIDWSVPCPSIFDRARPLADKTMRRIAAGIQKFVIEAAKPFIVDVNHGDLSANGARRWGAGFKDIDIPLSTTTAKNGCGLVSPTLIQVGYGERERQSPRVPGLDKPLGTVVAGGMKHALVAAFLAKHYGGVVGSSCSESLGTVTSIDHHSLVTAHIKRDFGTGVGHDASRPMATITSEGCGKCSLVECFLVKYNGTALSSSTGEPLATVTTRDRFALVLIEGQRYIISDIGMRMLTPRELYRAQGFPDSYQIAPLYKGKPMSKTSQVRMCGNSVCPPIAAAIARAQFVGKRSEVAA